MNIEKPTGFTMGSLWGRYGVAMGSLWSRYGVAMGYRFGNGWGGASLFPALPYLVSPCPTLPLPCLPQRTNNNSGFNGRRNSFCTTYWLSLS